MTVSLTLDTLLDQGGEADVYRVMGRPELLLKLFREEPSVEHRSRIERIIAQRNHELDAVAAWPQGWVQIGGRSALILPLVTNAQPIHVLFDRVSWVSKYPDATWEFMVKVALGAAFAVAKIHAAGFAVVDISEKNMLVGRDGRVTVIDCDSFVFYGQGASSISSCYSAGWPPPELVPCLAREPRTANHDNFSLARLIFQLLFAGRAPLESLPGSNLDDPRREFGYSEIHRVRSPSPRDIALSDLPARMAGYFERAFAKSDLKANLRPTAKEWAEALMEMHKTLQPCGRIPQHRYVSGAGRTCPWCRIAASPNGKDPFRSVDQPAAPATTASTVSPLPNAQQSPSSPQGAQNSVPPPPYQQTTTPYTTASRSRSEPSFEWLWTLVRLLTGTGRFLFRAAALTFRVSWVLVGVLTGMVRSMIEWAVLIFEGLRAAVGLLTGVVRSVFGWALLIGIGWFIIRIISGLPHSTQQVEQPVVAAPQGASAQQGDSVKQRAANYAVSLSADFSNQDASEILDQAYDQKVLYFGKTRSHAYVMHQKNSIIAAWTRRNYVPRAASVEVNCNQERTYCTVTLDTDFQVSNETKSNSGTWSSTVGLDMTRDPPGVVMEDGHAAQ